MYKKARRKVENAHEKHKKLVADFSDGLFPYIETRIMSRASDAKECVTLNLEETGMFESLRYQEHRFLLGKSTLEESEWLSIQHRINEWFKQEPEFILSWSSPSTLTISW